MYLSQHSHATQVEARRLLTNKEEYCTLEHQADHRSDRATYRDCIRSKSQVAEHRTVYVHSLNSGAAEQVDCSPLRSLGNGMIGNPG